ncbi:MAG: threonine synthase [Candidatus Omnitrophota bacterium]|nr:threonine synthase [Candidatus Omnitrophota bacterium]MBU1929212.1 threonine synthase [Candidatus Omnitrophota bacterium]MBU2034539.1 threonine synthase [Candidatus Omnitrophota bacterium]MBU2221206.1 threonine synthase [Candidatus Omnitrophota bacterium]
MRSDKAYKGLINKYKKYLPVTSNTPVITLNEGNTPLIYAPYLSKLLGKYSEVYLKYEGLNPTGSFKDRGMTLAISKSCEEGSKAVMCASTGNTSASAAAYAARAGIKCIVLIPSGAIALGKLSQALIHGAVVLAVDGNFDDALELVKEITAKYPITLVNSLNPFRIEGQKTASFEICDFLADSPDYQVMPVGNAGNITAYWKGYKEYKKIGRTSKLPRMLGFQAEGSAPIVKGHTIKNPQTLATAIRIGNPASWKQAEEARDESRGLIDMVSDREIIEAYKLLATKEGVFVEPASAASIAGLLKLVKKSYFKRGCLQRITCILTGHGLKDPDRAIKSIKPPKIIKPSLRAILKEIGY